MKLHGPMVSPYVARVVMCARAKAIELQPEPAPLGSFEGAGDAADNPFAVIPVLEVSGRSFADADVICEYLEDSFPERTIRPKDPLDRAQSLLVARTLDARVLDRLRRLHGNLDPATRNAAQVEAAVSELLAGLRQVEHCMGRGPYAVASTVTLADCALLPAMALLNLLFIPAFRLKSPVETHPKLREWWAQMGEDPLCVLMLQDWTMAFQELMRAQRMTGTGLNRSGE